MGPLGTSLGHPPSPHVRRFRQHASTACIESSESRNRPHESLSHLRTKPATYLRFFLLAVKNFDFCAAMSPSPVKFAVVDISDWDNRKEEISAQLAEAARTIGFFYVTGLLHICQWRQRQADARVVRHKLLIARHASWVTVYCVYAGHGISEERLKNAFELGRRWFELPIDEKEKYPLDPVECETAALIIACTTSMCSYALNCANMSAHSQKMRRASPGTVLKFA